MPTRHVAFLRRECGVVSGRLCRALGSMPGATLAPCSIPPKKKCVVSSATSSPRAGRRTDGSARNHRRRWIDEHPEYHADLADADAAVARVYDGKRRAREPVPAPVDAPVDQRAMLDRPAARHPPGGRVAGRAARLAARRASRSHGMPRPDDVGKPARRPPARRRRATWPAFSAAPRATDARAASRSSPTSTCGCASEGFAHRCAAKGRPVLRCRVMSIGRRTSMPWRERRRAAAPERREPDRIRAQRPARARPRGRASA